MLTDLMIFISAASLPMVKWPKLSPMSAFRLIFCVIANVLFVSCGVAGSSVDACQHLLRRGAHFPRVACRIRRAFGVHKEHPRRSVQAERRPCLRIAAGGQQAREACRDPQA